MANPNPTPRFRKLDDSTSALAKRIIKKYPRDFISAVVTGERGCGKSMYCFKTMAKVYFELDCLSEDEAYQKALDHMIFSMKDLILLIHRNIQKDIVTPVITLDDATVHFCTYEWFQNQQQVIHLHGVFDTIRTACTSVLLNCPKRKMLLSFLRQYDDLKIHIHRADGHWSRYARAYRWNWLPDETKKNISIPFQDNFSCHVKDKYFNAYMVKRKEALKEMDDAMLKTLGIEDEIKEFE
jgi:hypothetical protein